MQFCRPVGADSECCYVDVQTYLHLRSYTLAIVKPFTRLVTTICKYQIEPPNDSVVGVFAQTKLLGSHHIPIIGPAGGLTAISCDSITAKCIFVEIEEDGVFGYITPVTDFNCQ